MLLILNGLVVLSIQLELTKCIQLVFHGSKTSSLHLRACLGSDMTVFDSVVKSFLERALGVAARTELDHNSATLDFVSLTFKVHLDCVFIRKYVEFSVISSRNWLEYDFVGHSNLNTEDNIVLICVRRRDKEWRIRARELGTDNWPMISKNAHLHVLVFVSRFAVHIDRVKFRPLLLGRKKTRLGNLDLFLLATLDLLFAFVKGRRKSVLCRQESNHLLPTNDVSFVDTFSNKTGSLRDTTLREVIQGMICIFATAFDGAFWQIIEELEIRINQYSVEM